MKQALEEMINKIKIHKLYVSFWELHIILGSSNILHHKSSSDCLLGNFDSKLLR